MPGESKNNGGPTISLQDYKLTVNQAAKIVSYPLPKISDLFTSLAGGQTFSKLDLANAYLQIPLNEPSQRVVTINTHQGLYKKIGYHLEFLQPHQFFKGQWKVSFKVYQESVSN